MITAVIQTAAAVRELVDNAIVAVGEKALRWYGDRRFDERKTEEFLARGGGWGDAHALADYEAEHESLEAYPGETEDLAELGRWLIRDAIAKTPEPTADEVVTAFNAYQEKRDGFAVDLADAVSDAYDHYPSRAPHQLPLYWDDGVHLGFDWLSAAEALIAQYDITPKSYTPPK